MQPWYLHSLRFTEINLTVCDNCSSEILKHSSIYYWYLAYAGIWENLLSQWKKNQFCVFKSWFKKNKLANLKAIVLYIQFLFICHFHGTLVIRFWALFVFLEPFYLKECNFLKKYQSKHKISMQKRKLKVLRSLKHVPVERDI